MEELFFKPNIVCIDDIGKFEEKEMKKKGRYNNWSSIAQLTKVINFI